MWQLAQLNWSRILFTRIAAVLLGIASAFAVPAVAIIHSDTDLDKLSPVTQEALSITSAAGAFGFIALLICMGFFWLRCDPSPRQWRAVWFVILLAGFAFGSPIVYYLLVYLPAVRKRLRNPGHVSQETQMPEQPSTRRIGPFSHSFLFVWLVLLLPVAVALIFPRIMSHPLGPFATVCFGLWSCVVALEGVIHTITSIFRTGMRRPGGS